MNDSAIFNHLFEVAKTSKDPEGVVAACIVKNGEIIIASPSADDGIRHAEDLVLEEAKNQGITVDKDCVLYTTLEPCSYRNPKNNVKDCTTIIIDSGIKNIVFAGNDPEFSKEASNRFLAAEITFRQVKDKKVIKEAIELFNSTITILLTHMNLPRKKEIPLLK